jgi:hypothetical protein
MDLAQGLCQLVKEGIVAIDLDEVQRMLASSFFFRYHHMDYDDRCCVPSPKIPYSRHTCEPD